MQTARYGALACWAGHAKCIYPGQLAGYCGLRRLGTDHIDIYHVRVHTIEVPADVARAHGASPAQVALGRPAWLSPHSPERWRGQVRYASRRCRMEWISTVCLSSLMR